MQKIQTYGTIERGKLYILKRNEFTKTIAQLEDCDVKLTLTKLYDKRSNPQNGYYWGVIIDLFIQGWQDTQGEHLSREEAHEILKRECNYIEKINQTTGEVLRIGKTTTNLDTAEFEIYQERCRQFIWEWFRINVPLPDKDWRKKKEIQL